MPPSGKIAQPYNRKKIKFIHQLIDCIGEVAERFIAPVLKTGVPSRAP
jgi:hypothetical protein